MQVRRYVDIVKAIPPVAKEYIMRDSIILRDVSTINASSKGKCKSALVANAIWKNKCR